MKKFQVKISEQSRSDLEKYRYTSGLYEEGLRVSEVANKIITDWIENPILDKDKLTLLRFKEERSKCVAIYLSKEQYRKLRKIMFKNYPEGPEYTTTVIYNILKQFLENNQLKKDVI